MKNKPLTTLIVIILIFLILISMTSFMLGRNNTVTAASSTELQIDTKLRFMGDKGGGELEVTLEGELARNLRENIDNDIDVHQGTGGYQDGMVTGTVGGGATELSKYVELVEDRLEGTSENTNDNPPESYKTIYKGINIGRTGQNQGVNIITVEGLSGSSTDSTSRIWLHIELKSETIDFENDILFSDAYVIYYALFGNLSGAESVECEDTFEMVTIGFGSYSSEDMEGGGNLAHYRHLGEYVTYENSYNILEGKGEKQDTILYQKFSMVQSPIILLIIFLILGIMVLAFPRYQAHKHKRKKVLWLRVLVIVLFILLLLLFIFGFDGLYIWMLSIIFTVISAVLSVGVYSLGWVKTQPQEPEESKPEKTEPDTSWHEQGMVFFEAGDYEEAKKCFGKALVEEPENEVIWNDMGYIFRKQSRHQEALKCFNKALKLNPNYKAARTNLQQSMKELRAERTQR